MTILTREAHGVFIVASAGVTGVDAAGGACDFGVSTNGVIVVSSFASVSGALTSAPFAAGLQVKDRRLNRTYYIPLLTSIT